MILTSPEWAGVLTFLLACFGFAVKRAVLRQMSRR